MEVGCVLMHGGMEDRGRGLVLWCVFEDRRLELTPGQGLGFQLHVRRVCSLVCVDRLQSRRIVTGVLPAGPALADSAGHLRARALFSVSGDSGTRKMVETRPSIGRRPHHHAAGLAGGAVRRLRRESRHVCAWGSASKYPGGTRPAWRYALHLSLVEEMGMLVPE